jgi:putative sterol carrier protein
MMAIFPTAEWVSMLMDKLNTDEHYRHIAHKWEGDMLFVVEADGVFPETIRAYLDLWHGKCRAAYLVSGDTEQKAAFTLKAPYQVFVRVLNGELDPMQALMTRKLGIQGNMGTLMRNVPTVLDFVRCCQEVTDSIQ